MQRGALFGYDSLVWTLVILQSFGGLMVALVIKYADNIVKGFATSASIVLASIVSMFAFDFVITWQFALGTTLVITSVWLYGRYPVTPNSNALPK
jgi:solute carrier family 35 (UDP-sugar transporter), member A1/2/3